MHHKQPIKSSKKTLRAYPSHTFLTTRTPIEDTLVYTFKSLGVRVITKRPDLTRGVPFLNAYSLCNPMAFDYKTWANDEVFESLESSIGPPKEHLMWIALTDSSTGNLIYAHQPYLSKEYALSLASRINKYTHERLLKLLELIEEDAFNKEVTLLRNELAQKVSLLELKDQEINMLRATNKDQQFLIDLITRVNEGLRERERNRGPPPPFNITELLDLSYW